MCKIIGSNLILRKRKENTLDFSFSQQKPLPLYPSPLSPPHHPSSSSSPNKCEVSLLNNKCTAAWHNNK